MSATKRRNKTARKTAIRRPLTIVVMWADMEPAQLSGFRRAICDLVGTNGRFLVALLPVPQAGPFAGRSDIEIRQVDPKFDKAALMVELRRMFEERGGTVVDDRTIETA